MMDTKDSNAIKDEAMNEDVSTTKNVQVATPYDFSRDDAVTLVVGPEEKEMFVHGTYLTDGSDFFKAALKKEWTEGQTRVIKFPEEDPETMAHFMTFVYHGQLPFEGVLPQNRNDYAARWCILIDLYVYGERFLYRWIQNAVIKEMVHLTRTKSPTGGRWFPTSAMVDRVYRGTPEGSPLRRLIVDAHVIFGKRDWLSKNANAQFLLDLAKAFYGKIDPDNKVQDFRMKDLDAATYLSKT
jgi:hypothetical protein